MATCEWASVPQSSRHHAQNAVLHTPHVKAQQPPSKPTGQFVLSPVRLDLMADMVHPTAAGSAELTSCILQGLDQLYEGFWLGFGRTRQIREK